MTLPCSPRAFTPCRQRGYACLCPHARWLALLFAMLLAPGLITSRVALAQGGDQGSLTGTVTDASGAIVPNATVSVLSTATQLTRTVQTNSAGFFTLQALEPGDYTLTISQSGFESSITKGIHLDPGQQRENNVSLQVGATTQSVVVEANAAQIETEASENAGVVTAKQVEDLEVNGRNFESLGQLVPGVSSTTGGNAQGGGGLFGGNTLIVNGQSIEYTLYTLDGVEDMNTGNLSALNVQPILDAIQEFRVVKDNYSAKYGFSGGAQFVVQTKSGTDKFHGSAWDFLRNNAFDARNYFNSSTSALHQNIFGYTFGGPLSIPHVYSNHRTFFFASNQWQLINSGVTEPGATLTLAQRAGNFSGSPTAPANGLTLDAHSAALLASEGKTNCVPTPTTVNPACFDPVATSLLSTYLLPPNNAAGGFNNYLNTGASKETQLDYIYRVDHYFSPNEILTGRAMYETVSNAFPYNNFDGSPFTTVAWNVYTTGANYLGRLTSTFTPRLVNIFNAAESYDKPRLNTPNQTLPAGTNITQSYGPDPLNRIPHVTFSGGYSPLSTWFSPVHASDGEGIVSDDLTYTLGKHSLQTGIFYVFGIKNQNVFTYPQGAFTFSGVHTGDPAADFLLGLDATYSQANAQPSGSFHYRQTEAYVQDDWHATQALTLNLGLRWQYFSSDTVTGNQLTSFFPNTWTPSQAPVVLVGGQEATNANNVPITAAGVPANTLNGIVYAGKNGVPAGFFDGKHTLFGPRVGFAYAIGAHQQASIRGGYGIGYTHLPVEFAYDAFGANPPYNQSTNILNSLLSNGTAGTGAAPTPQTLHTIPASFTPSRLQTYSLTYQQQFSRSLIASLGYAGSVVDHIIADDDINFPLPVSAPSTAGCIPANQVPAAQYQFDPCINAGLASENYTRPYAGWAGIYQEASPGRSNYNGLQFGLSYRTTHLQIMPAYTYSKSLTDLGGRSAGATGALDGDAPQDYRNYSADYGPPSYDRPHVFSTSIVYDLPSPGNKLMRETIGGWTFAGLTLMESGYAISPGLATTNTGLATRPDYAGPLHKVGKVNEWFSTSSFSAPPPGFFGTAATGSIRGPSEFVGNAALYKTFGLYENFRLQFRAEAFNVANHTNFANVSTSLGSGNFGAVTSAQDPRILEFALRLTF